MIIVIVLLLVCRLYPLQTNRSCLAAKIWTPKIAFKKVPEIPGHRPIILSFLAFVLFEL